MTNNVLVEQKKIKHLYNNEDLTFKQIKEIFIAAASGQLEGKEKVKGDKVLISFCVNDGKIKLALQKSDIMDGGLICDDFIKKLSKTNSDLQKDTFLDGIKSFEKAIQGLDIETQTDIFGPETNIYYNADIVHPSSKSEDDFFNYDTRKILLNDLGHYEYDRATGDRTGAPMSDKINKLKKIILNFQDSLKHENYSVETLAIKRLQGLSDKTPLNTCINRINSLILSTNNLIKNPNLKLNEDSTINDFMIARVYILLNSILNRAPAEIGQFSPIAKTNIAKRLFDIKGISVIDIKNNLSPSQFSFIKDNVFWNEKNILKKAIYPIENIIHDFSVEMLKNMHSAFIIDNNKKIDSLKDKIENAISEIQKNGNENDLVFLKKELSKLKNLDNIKTFSKGFIFDYDGTTYKFSPGFSPIKKLLNIFDRIKNSQNKEIKIDIKEAVLNEQVIEEIIKKRGSKYCLLSKKNKKNLGCYNTKAGAKKREKQVQYFKNIKEEGAGGVAGSANAIQGAPFVNKVKKRKRLKNG